MKRKIIKKATQRLLPLAGVLVYLCGCVHSKDQIHFSSAAPAHGEAQVTTPTNTPAPLTLSTVLSRENAALRSKMVTHVSYLLNFELNADSPEFQGKTLVRFDLKPKAQAIHHRVFLDLEGGTIKSVLLNGTAIANLSSKDRWDSHQIYFDLEELKPSGNQIEVTYSHPFSTDGRGLHRFQDPADGRVYLYSHFEPYDAHRLFPCFDQPDLKATYELSVEAPSDWEVISNTLYKSTAIKNKTKTWAFPPTATFSTYVFALHAGPFTEWKEKAGDIPIRLFSRKSIAKYVDHEEWLQVTQQGLDYFGTQFAIPYPFGKYDQVIVPDFNAGAMENVGAITFSEKFVYRSHVTTDRRRSRAATILHEMAHMWFGDLVTMRWWNGLWLNESFASFMATLAVDQATGFKGGWQAFFSGLKQWAYWEDQLVTTHPIELPVQDTAQAKSIFDGITYGKGASVLKQLYYTLGEDDFREGLQRYFQRHSYKNTSLNDFFSSLSEASGIDLNEWQQNWLQTTGINTIRVQWECETDPKSQRSTISKFDIIQESETRPHTTAIGLFYLPKGKNNAKNSLFKVQDPLTEISYHNGITSVRSALKKPCPDLVFPNYQDYDYVKVELDPISLQQALTSIHKIEDPLTRQMLWHTLWEMVREGKTRAQDYANAVIANAPNEKDTLVLSQILGTLGNSSPHSSSVLKFLEGADRKQVQIKIESLIQNQLLRASPGSDQQLVWYRTLLDNPFTDFSLLTLKKLLAGNLKLKGFVVDQEHRWEMIQSLATQGGPEIGKLIEEELKHDATDMGQKASIAAEARIPDPASKKKWLNLMTESPTSMPVAKLREAMYGFQILGQDSLIQSTQDSYFEILPKLTESHSVESEELANNFAQYMYPSLCDPKNIIKTTRLLESHPDLPALVIKRLKIHKQEEERCVKAREKSRQTL